MKQIRLKSVLEQNNLLLHIAAGECPSSTSNNQLDGAESFLLSCSPSQKIIRIYGTEFSLPCSGIPQLVPPYLSEIHQFSIAGPSGF
jgi:hypothetical protein